MFVEPLVPTNSTVPKGFVAMSPLERTIMSSNECIKKAPVSLGVTHPNSLSATRMDSAVVTPMIPIMSPAYGDHTTMSTTPKLPIMSTPKVLPCTMKVSPRPPQKDLPFIPDWMPAARHKPERKSKTNATTTKALVSGALDFQSKSLSAADLDHEMALLPPTMTAFCSGIFTHMMSPSAVLEVPPPPPRRYPAKTPRRSHNMLPFEFPPVQPIAFDDDDELEPLPVDLTPLKPFITQGSQDSGPAARSEDAVPMTQLASYLSDFFDKKYFPISSTSRYFSGTECKVAPLEQQPPKLSVQSPTTVHDDFFDNDEAIVSYNQALFEDDLDDKLQAVEAFPDF